MLQTLLDIYNKLIGKDSPKWVRYTAYTLILGIFFSGWLFWMFDEGQQRGMFKSDCELLNDYYTNVYIVKMPRNYVDVTEGVIDKVYADGTVLSVRNIQLPNGGETQNFCWNVTEPVQMVLRRIKKRDDSFFLSLAHAGEHDGIVTINCPKGTTPVHTDEALNRERGISPTIRVRRTYENGCQVELTIETTTMKIIEAGECTCP